MADKVVFKISVQIKISLKIKILEFHFQMLDFYFLVYFCTVFFIYILGIFINKNQQISYLFFFFYLILTIDHF